jgi:hypothetical protein
MEQVTNKNVLLGIITVLILGTALFAVPNNDAVGEQQQVPFSQLTDTDVDMILAVKAEMAHAREVRAQLAGSQHPELTASISQ